MEAAGFLRVAEDGLVGGLDGGVEAGPGGVWIEFRSGGGFGGEAGGGRDGDEEGFECEVTGDFTGGGSAHAVAYGEDAALGDGSAGVFIGVADAAGVGEHGEGERRGGGFGGFGLPGARECGGFGHVASRRAACREGFPG